MPTPHGHSRAAFSFTPRREAVQCLMSDAEDKAIREGNPSDDPGAETGDLPASRCSSLAFSDWHQSDKCLGGQPRTLRIGEDREHRETVSQIGVARETRFSI